MFCSTKCWNIISVHLLKISSDWHESSIVYAQGLFPPVSFDYLFSRPLQFLYLCTSKVFHTLALRRYLTNPTSWLGCQLDSSQEISTVNQHVLWCTGQHFHLFTDIAVIHVFSMTLVLRWHLWCAAQRDSSWNLGHVIIVILSANSWQPGLHDLFEIMFKAFGPWRCLVHRMHFRVSQLLVQWHCLRYSFGRTGGSYMLFLIVRW